MYAWAFSLLVLVALVGQGRGFSYDPDPDEGEYVDDTSKPMSWIIGCTGGRLYNFTINEKDRKVAALPNDCGTSVLMIIHGQLDKSYRKFQRDIVNAERKHKPQLVAIHTDWPSARTHEFYEAATSTQRVGKENAKLLDAVLSKLRISPDDVHVIGHSMGCHVAAATGRNVNRKVGRITAFDPVATETMQQPAIKPQDAQFVDSIHTTDIHSGEEMGYMRFYPNGGEHTYTEPQHFIGLKYYLESIGEVGRGQKYKAQNCDSWESYEKKTCKGEYNQMGYWVNKNAPGGAYYIKLPGLSSGTMIKLEIPLFLTLIVFLYNMNRA